MEQKKIETLASVKVLNSPDLYKIVDILNRTLKDHDFMFGLALAENDETKAVFTIYKT
jgi:uncharacterized protein YgfB (UPF0149 family)